jgi:probable rRNA maturation factor
MNKTKNSTFAKASVDKRRPKTKAFVKTEIANQQKIKRINVKIVSLILRKVFYLLDKPSAQVSVLFCDNDFITRLNKRFFKKSWPTDVIAFPLQDGLDAKYLGEIVISVEQAANVCGFYGKKWQEELTLYLIHGVLHLLGYDDTTAKEKKIMDKKQEKILSELLKNNKRIIDI